MKITILKKKNTSYYIKIVTTQGMYSNPFLMRQLSQKDTPLMTLDFRIYGIVIYY